MIGLRIKLTLDGKLLDEIELRGSSLGTDVLEKIRDSEERAPFQIHFRDSTPSERYKRIMDSYYLKIMSNQHFELSVSSFLYNEETGKEIK